MPTYDYVCKECGHRFERFQKMSDGNLRKCPECGERKLKRLMGIGAGVIFRGSGFYETDYKRKTGSNGRARTSTNGAGSSSEKESPEKTEKTEKTGNEGSGSKKND